MTRYLLDTNHAGALLRDHPQVRSRIQAFRGEEICVCLPSVGELGFMVYNSTRPTQNRPKLLTLLAHLTVVPFGPTEAEEFGRIRVELRQQGRPIPQIDVQIAAIARAGGFTLATTDSHFAYVKRLTIEDWTRP